MERDQPLQERPGNLPRQRTIVNKLLLVSSVIQCIGLFVCLIYILGASQPPKSKNDSVKVHLMDYDEKNGFTLQSSGEFGSIKVQNNSLKIRCDGFYLLRLKGYFSRTPNIDFHYRNNQRFYLFSNFSSYQYINSVAVVYLRFEDLIYQRVVSQKVSSTDLAFSQGEISLIQLTNDNFCGK
ncbi:tumor necrosis factor ligand superfamily member 4 [Phascolarctos cinereus]|uniref:Tumor necrosis factor ligand superfamily member 4 n=1 Tax=Phascolarctos cinereus TaxID=38626 RepID=A0A6P5IVJ7_PHACI|nr:tumor necrosis factor ligand superfamily member 4 [Phascolarctos cinereus]